MKYLKLFENQKSYEIGDYVIAYKQQGVIIDINNSILPDTYYIKGEPVFFRNKLHDTNCFWAEKSDIERKMTPEEVEIFKLNRDVYKYNL